MVLRVALVLLLAVFATGVARAHQDHYPMAATAYRKRLAERLERYEQRLEQRMREHKIAEPRRRTARARLARLATELRKLAAEAGRDRTITRSEAERIKARGKQVRAAIYEALGLEPHRKGE